MKLKNIKFVLIPAAVALLLTGCSTGSAELPNHSYEGTLYWNTEDFDLTSWPSGEIVQGEDMLSPVSSMSDEQIYMISEDETCNLSASIQYIDADKANRGDRFNSLNYIYDNAGEDSYRIDKTSTEEINGVTFLVAEYEAKQYFTTRDSADELNLYKKTAVRAFNTAIPMPSLGNDGNGGKEVLPVAEISITCLDKKDLTDTIWKNGTERFKLDFTGESRKSSISDPLTGQEDHVGSGEIVEELVPETVAEEVEIGEETPIPQPTEEELAEHNQPQSVEIE